MGNCALDHVGTMSNVLNSDDGVVARNLDQLETSGRYSVVYEIARIETLLNQIAVPEIAAS